MDIRFCSQLLMLLLALFATPELANAQASALYHVANNSGLQGLASTAYPVAVRDGYAAAGDSPPLPYVSSSYACTLNSGNGDNGYQVKSSDSKCWIAQFPGGTGDEREWGVIADGSTHSGNAANLSAALSAMAALNGRVYVPPVAATVIDATVTLPATGASILGAGAGSGSSLKAAASTNLTNGILYGATANGFTLQDLEINGNKANEGSYAYTCVSTGAGAGQRLLAFKIHDCPSDNIALNGSYIRIDGESDNSAGRMLLLGWITSADHVNVTLQGDTAVIGGITCGSCTNFDIEGVISNVDPSQLWSDCFTDYGTGSANGRWSGVCNTSGNHCAHFGGSNQSFDLVCIGTQGGVEVFTVGGESNGTVTIGAGGSTSVTGSGTTFTDCPHNCQSWNGVGGAPTIVINGATYNIDHVVDATHLVTSTTVPACTACTYQTRYTALSSGFQGKAVFTTGPLGNDACFAYRYLTGGTFDISCNASAGSGIAAISSTNVTINANISNAVYDGINIGGGYPWGVSLGWTNNSSTVTVASGFLSNAAIGDTVSDAAVSCKITAIASDTNATVTCPTGTSGHYPGTTGSKSSYIVWNSDNLTFYGQALNNGGNGITTNNGTNIRSFVRTSGNTGWGVQELLNSGFSYPNCYAGEAQSNSSGNFSLNLGSQSATCNPGGVSGSGATLLANSPTLVTPALGTRSAINLTNATDIPAAGTSTNGGVTAKQLTTFSPTLSFTTPGSSSTSPTTQDGQYSCTNGVVTGNALWVGTISVGTGSAGALVWNNLPYTIGDATNMDLILSGPVGLTGSWVSLASAAYFPVVESYTSIGFSSLSGTAANTISPANTPSTSVHIWWTFTYLTNTGHC